MKCGRRDAIGNAAVATSLLTSGKVLSANSRRKDAYQNLTVSAAVGQRQHLAYMQNATWCPPCGVHHRITCERR